MGSKKQILIGKLFDLLLYDKNFETCNVKQTKDDFTTLEFSTKYIGNSNWIKIKIPFNIDENEIVISFEKLIDKNIIKLENITIDKMFDELNNIPVRP